MDYTVHGFLQARILEWVAIPFCRASSQLMVQATVRLSGAPVLRVRPMRDGDRQRSGRSGGLLPRVQAVQKMVCSPDDHERRRDDCPDRFRPGKYC